MALTTKTRWIAGGVLMVGAAALSVPVTMLTLPNVLPGVERARLADAPIATSPAARAAAAALAFQENQEPETLEKVERWANAAVLDDPLEVSAIRSLSFVHAYRGDAEQAMKLLRYGESLSRRDLMTELALALEAQQAGSNAEAVRHYGHALSTTGRGYDLIVSQVLTATQDAEFARTLGEAMADRPIWRIRFLPLFIVRNESPESLAAVAAGIWADGVPADEQGTAVSVVDRLLRLGAQNEAAVLIRKINADKTGALVRNGDFEATDAGALGWRFETGASLSALPTPSPDGTGRALEMRAGSGHLGSVARQTLALAQGEYTLSARLSANGQADASMPRVTVTCAGGEGEGVIAELRRDPANEQRQAEFAVPAACGVQFLDVRFGSSVFVTDSRGYADDITIVKR